MNIQELFSEQETLDNFIMEKLQVKGVNIEGSQLLAYRLLALSTELGELADATEDERLEEFADLHHFVMSVGNLAKVDIPYADSKFRDLYKSLKLNEENDWLETLKSFIVAFSKFANVTKVFKYWKTSDKEMVMEYVNVAYMDMYLNLFYLGYSFGFTAAEIEDSYIRKNKINYERQLNNY